MVWRDMGRFLRVLDEAGPAPLKVMGKTRRSPDLGLVSRHIRTSRGGLNAPKRQPCPECNKGSRRTLKSGAVAMYRCPRHGEFPVKLRK